MLQRGRKSANLLVINTSDAPPRLTAPSGLSVKERALFEELVTACDPKHFRKGDTPLLVSLVQAMLMAHRLGRNPNKVAEWEKAVRVMAMLATKLRMTPQARTDPKTIAHQRQHSGTAPWHRKGDDDEQW
jgi:hypothetical protein